MWEMVRRSEFLLWLLCGFVFGLNFEETWFPKETPPSPPAGYNLGADFKPTKSFDGCNWCWELDDGSLACTLKKCVDEKED